jgi:hypothetical protein
MDVIIQAAMGIVGTVVGVVVGSLLGKRNAIDLIHRQEFIRAATKFREAFIFEIDFLKHGKSPISSLRGTVFDVLTKAYKTHRIAYETFRIDIPEVKRRDFDKAWEEYLYPICDKGKDPLDDYISEGDEPEKRKLAHDKISNLLKYTEKV